MPALPQITWMGVLDVLLVAFVLYQFLRLVKGTRAAQMLVGVGALLVLLLVLRQGRLPVTNWIISHLLPYGLFALIVVFQAEIRHVLARVGRLITLGGSIAE